MWARIGTVMASAVRTAWARIPERIREPITEFVRTNRWGIAMAAFVAAAYVLIYANDPAAHTPGADGHYTWLYARSLVYDGDLHFANDYAICGDPFALNIDRGGGRPDNPFYP